jgi:hypothetical protein
MPRTFAAAGLLAVLAVLPPGEAVAGPPEVVSGKMVLDEVADGLRRYRRVKDEGKRVECLEKLALSRDVRVAVALGEYLDGERDKPDYLEGDSRERCSLVARLLYLHYTDRKDVDPEKKLSDFFRRDLEEATGHFWWRENEADLRRRAKQLPK